MNPESAQRVEALCLEALSKSEPDRGAFLDQACGGDDDLRREVESLLAGRSAVGVFLETPAWAAATPLAPGARLGPYEIEARIGAGGMGEVYKARDTRLDRVVAVKVLPPALSADPERRARFEREARAIAALSHPHICTLHDIGEAVPSSPETRGQIPEPVHYLVMEHLAGVSLAERLRRGPVPLPQALDIAAQIAEALDAAHKHGIVHRDLKPGNVMLAAGGNRRSAVMTAKLLDFGLAKLARHGERQVLASEARGATGAAPVTAHGTILGTLPYMAPEQLEGQEADARTDLWALGAILYEMVSGRRAFAGDSEANLIDSIVNAEPTPLTTMQPLTPPSLERVVKRCLAKHPDDRWDSAHDVADELRWIQEASVAWAAASVVQPHRASWRRTATTVVVALAAALAGAAFMWLAQRAFAPAAAVARTLLEVTPAEALDAGKYSGGTVTPGGSRTAFAWMPDGKTLAFVGRAADVRRLYLRRLDQPEAMAVARTEGIRSFALSPDGRWVAFVSDGKLRKVPIDGGPPVEIGDGVSEAAVGLFWARDGDIFYGGGADGLIHRATAAGRIDLVSTREEGRSERHMLPWLLPGGRVLLYTIRRQRLGWGDEEVVAHVLATGERKTLLRNAVDARFVAPGYLVFLRLGALFAVAFDPDRVEIRGVPAPLLEGVGQALVGGNDLDINGSGQFAVASTGDLAWIPASRPEYATSTAVQVDRQGRVSPLGLPPGSYAFRVLPSPDGRRLHVGIKNLEKGERPWIWDLDRTTWTPVSGDGETSWRLLSPDGRWLAFDWTKDGRSWLALQQADGSGSPMILAPGFLIPSSWTPDGKHLAGVEGGDLVVADIDNGKATTHAFEATPRSVEGWPEFSPDGRWLAYGSNVSERHEVYVRPYPGPGPTHRVSIEGGVSPAWGRDGRELFFLTLPDSAGRRSMMAVDFAPGENPTVGRPRHLFAFDPKLQNFFCTPVRCFSVSADGKRFFCLQPVPTAPLPPVTHINLIQNWFEELKAKVPAVGT